MKNNIEESKTTMLENGFIPKLISTINELKITRNALAVEAKVRPLTINEIASGKVKQVNFVTLYKILDALNKIAIEKGINKTYSVSDIFDYKQN